MHVMFLAVIHDYTAAASIEKVIMAAESFDKNASQTYPSDGPRLVSGFCHLPTSLTSMLAPAQFSGFLECVECFEAQVIE